MTPPERSAILDKIGALVLDKHIDPADLRRDYSAWQKSLEAKRLTLTNKPTDEEFERGVQAILAELRTSHMGFMRPSNPGMGAIFSLNASLGAVTVAGEQYWMIQHVIEDGPAARASVRPGELLMEVNGEAVRPPAPALFRLGQPQALLLENWRTRERRRVTVELPAAAKDKGRPPMVVPKLVTSKMLDGNVGYVRGTYFQGVIGLDFIRDFNAATEALQSRGAKAFVLDFRANPGGGLASQRVMSWLTPNRTEIGYSLTRKAIRAGWEKTSLPCIDKLPATKLQQLAMVLKYRVWNRDRSVALATEGLGVGRLQGRSVLLFDENSRSAAEMVAAFAAEHKLAPLVGTKTPGEVLGAVNFKLPHNYRLRMPVSTWCTWAGETIEGKGVAPNVRVELTPEALSEGVDSQMDRAREIASSL